MGYIVFADNFSDQEQWTPVDWIQESKEWGNEFRLDVSNDMYATTCTHLPESGFDVMAPPDFQEMADLAATLGVTLTPEAYELVLAVGDPLEFLASEGPAGPPTEDGEI